MSDITVLERNMNNRWRVVMHFPVPAGNNTAGVSWRDALVASGIGGTTILPDGDGTGGTISTADKVKIVSGALLEHVESVRLGDGNPQSAAEELYNSRKADKATQLQARLNQYGRNVDVP